MKRKRAKHPVSKTRKVTRHHRKKSVGKTVLVKAGTIVGNDVRLAGCCEGTYNCVADGTIYKIGDQSKIGFFDKATCPGSTTLADGSTWNLVPGTCSC